MFSLFCQEIYIAYYVITILSWKLSHIMFSLYCRKSQCLLFTFRNFLWYGILWLGILLLGTLCVRNFVIMNFETRNFVPAPWAHLCVSSTVQQSVLSPEVSVLHQLVLYLDVSVQQQPVLCQKMAYSSLWCTWTVCLREPVLHRDVSACLQELLCAPEVSVKYMEPVLHLCVSVYKSFCVHLRCLSTI